MARSFARWDVNSWTANDDWRDLEPLEQWCYMMLTSQAKLSICGAIDLKLTVWSQYAAGMPPAVIDDLIVALERKQYVAVDRDTEELVIRSFTKHDGCFANQNTGRGVWRAIDSVASPRLREVIVENLPDIAFQDRFHPRFERPSIHRSNSGSDAGSNLRTRTDPIPMPEADSPLKGGVQRGENETDAADRFLHEIPVEAM